MLAPHSYHPTLLHQISMRSLVSPRGASCSVTADILQKIKKFYITPNLFILLLHCTSLSLISLQIKLKKSFLFINLTCFMSKIYIGSAKRGDAGVEIPMSGIIVMFTLFSNGESESPSGATSYNT